jgi:hypothetical protein
MALLSRFVSEQKQIDMKKHIIKMLSLGVLVALGMASCKPNSMDEQYVNEKGHVTQ